jgi:hypothetical protein
MIVIIPIAFMSNQNITPSRLGAPIVLAAAMAVAAVALAAGSGTPSAKGAAQAAAAGSLSFQPVLGLPATNVAIIGASPGEATEEVWAQGTAGGTVAGQSVANATALLRYTGATGTWQVVPVDDAQDNPLNFTWWGSEVTADGGVVLAGGEDTSGAGGDFTGTEGIVTRDPGGAFVQVEPPNSEAPAQSDEAPVLEPGEQLYADGTQIAALDEPGGHTGALIVPAWISASSSKAKVPLGPGVLHYDGSAWTREPLCSEYSADTCTPASATLQPLAIAASSPQDAWLIASSSHGPALFQRVAPASGAAPSITPVWVQVQFTSGLLSNGNGGAPAGETVSALSSGPILTPTSQGVWVDLALAGGPQPGSATLLASASSPGTVLGTWCYPAPVCPAATPSLGAPLPDGYHSFAWAGSGSEPGTRIITGLHNGALLRLAPGRPAFEEEAGGGAGGAGASGPGGVTQGQQPGEPTRPDGGAAFASPSEGWLGSDVPSGSSTTPQVIHVTTTPTADQLQAWPVPFRRPLLAIAAQPGTTPGEAGAQALAVGADGQVARYVPGQGWIGEYLYNSNGERKTPNLRGVAWPEPGRAYAVGDEGNMWLWQAQTGLWESDPGKPLGLDAQLTAIAFSASDPDLGYAVGKQGTLLSYGKSWTQETPPPGLSQANFTSVAFAGEEAIATYRMLDPSESDPSREIGGLIVNEDGSGWHQDPSAQALLGETGPVLSKVAGLPNGGAVAAGPGIVIERNSATSPWHRSAESLPEAANIAALAAIEEDTAVRALVSLDTGAGDNPNGSLTYEGIDNPPGPALSQYPVLLGPDPLPEDGYLLRETATGWQDQEDRDYPTPYAGEEDLPGWPDAVLALLLDPGGDQGWAVGGQTGTAKGATETQTAGVMRYGAGPAPPQNSDAPVPTPAGTATFALGGNAQCASPCAARANENLGPDAWLSGALSRANQIAGLHAFLYSGTRVAAGAPGDPGELKRYASLLGGGGPLPVYAAISPTDISSPGAIAGFTEALGGIAPAGTAPAGSPPPPAGSAAYAFESPGAGGTVRVIVLDDSTSTSVTGQISWLAEQLANAKTDGKPTIVLGNAPLTEPVSQTLIGGGASAYLFDSPGENITETLGSGAEAVKVYGSGTLGYNAFAGDSGFLTVSVNVAKRKPTNWAPVTATMVPSIGQLAIDATNGTLVRRSNVALFEGLARRPIGGYETSREGEGGKGNIDGEGPDPYVTIPQAPPPGCVVAGCAQYIPPAYTFTSSQPDIGSFVEANLSPTTTSPARTVLQVKGKPVPVEPRNAKGELIPGGRYEENANGEPINEKGEVIPSTESGLFCAYNAGTTIVTLTTGGISYSEPVTVQAGSIEQPCGTVPLTNPAQTSESQSLSPIAPLPPEAIPPTTNPSPSLTLPPPAAPTPVVPPPVAHHPPAAVLPPLLTAAVVPVPARAAVPPPSPQAARPAPPSGTSEVSEPVGVAEKEREEQGAADVVHNMAAYEPGGNALPPWSPLPLILIAAAAGTSLRRRRPDRRPMLARARARTDYGRGDIPRRW